ncbi:MAG TPA: SUMF1/EgtB/PvdO family nonheme iron enzyme [Chthoniobacterales bacterium]|nr:SUMF1/EgtB/PvdO family nonheme iron enzyme [Chthoniobacterales bacterium]
MLNLKTGLENGDLPQYTWPQKVFSKASRTVKVCHALVKIFLRPSPYEISSTSNPVFRLNPSIECVPTHYQSDLLNLNQRIDQPSAFSLQPAASIRAVGRIVTSVLVLLFLSLFSIHALGAQVDGSGSFSAHASTPSENSDTCVDLSFVTVGHPNNKADVSTGYGAVPYVFSIGTYDVTALQYCAFLNAVARHSDPYGLYHRGMSFDSEVAVIKCLGEEVNHNYVPIQGREELPITFVTLYAAARFCNWLHNGQPIGEEGDGTTETGAYTLNGTLNGVLVRNEDANYFIPNENEWYKAAYYDAEGKSYYAFPNRSSWSPKNNHNLITPYNNEANYAGFDGGEEDMQHLTPVGFFSTTMSPYGAFDMGGNVAQWTETNKGSEVEPLFTIRGGSWKSCSTWGGGTNDLEKTVASHADPQQAKNTIGFRVAKAGASETSSRVLSAIPDTGWLTPAEMRYTGLVATGIALSAGIGAALITTETAAARAIAGERFISHQHPPLLAEHFRREELNAVSCIPNRSPFQDEVSVHGQNQDALEPSLNCFDLAQAHQKKIQTSIEDLRSLDANIRGHSEHITQHTYQGLSHLGNIVAHTTAAPLTWRLLDQLTVAFGNTFGTYLVTTILNTPPPHWHDMVITAGHAVAGITAAATAGDMVRFLSGNIPSEFGSMKTSFAEASHARNQLLEARQEEKKLIEQLQQAKAAQTTFYQEFVSRKLIEDSNSLEIKCLRLDALAHLLVECPALNKKEYDTMLQNFIEAAEHVYTKEIIDVTFPQEEREAMREKCIPWTYADVDTVIARAGRVWDLYHDDFQENSSTINVEKLREAIVQDARDQLERAQRNYDNLNSLETPFQEARLQTEKCLLHGSMALGPTVFLTALSYGTMALTGPHLAMALAVLSSFKSDSVVAYMHALAKAGMRGVYYNTLPDATRTQINDVGDRLSILPLQEINASEEITLTPENSAPSKRGMYSKSNRRISMYLQSDDPYNPEQHTKFHFEKASAAAAGVSEAIARWYEIKAAKVRLEDATCGLEAVTALKSQEEGIVTKEHKET